MPKKKQTRPPDLIDLVGELLVDVKELGYAPVLIGGMALVVHGSSRVTRDFDFLVAREMRENEKLIRLLYRHHLELVAALDERGHVTSTIGNPKVAVSRLRIDQPRAAFFFNNDRGLKIDLLFDYPIPAEQIRANALKKKVKSYTFLVANKTDLAQLKRIAADKRGFASDKQDVEFLDGLDESE